MRKRLCSVCVGALTLGVFCFAAAPAAHAEPNHDKPLGDAAPVPRPGIAPDKAVFQPPIKMLSPEKSKQHFHVPEGYKLELVISEPHIKEPVAIVFDGNGRMYVAEMRTYMQNIDGKGQHKPKSRVSMHWDSNGDGRYDKHSVFIDDLVLPRMMLTMNDGLLVAETNNNDIYHYRDTNGDGEADTKELFYDANPSDANLEHQTSGLIWANDNWLYTTYHGYRLRWTPDGVEKEKIAYAPGQWGLTQDNYGKPWHINAGGELGPVNFQQPIAYGAFRHGNELASDWKRVYPLVSVPDVQGGPDRLRDNNTLNHFTATCGDAIFRGDRLPDVLQGDLLFAEPVGRLVRRGEVTVDEGITKLENVYDQAEFIRSTDPNFRPVNMNTAPDGTLYIVDMYRGIIQESTWVGKGSYLRKVVKRYGLQKNIGRGRIWRLVHEDHERGKLPNMLDQKSAKLVEHLAHPNGWWRSEAQKLLILRQAHDIAPRLKKMAKQHDNHLARFHAIWTLEGLGDLTPDLVQAALEDDNPHVRRAAIRASERLFKRNRASASLRKAIGALHKDANPNVAIQVMLTARKLGWPNAKELARKARDHSDAKGVQFIARKCLK